MDVFIVVAFLIVLAAIILAISLINHVDQAAIDGRKEFRTALKEAESLLRHSIKKSDEHYDFLCTRLTEIERARQKDNGEIREKLGDIKIEMIKFSSGQVFR